MKYFYVLLVSTFVFQFSKAQTAGDYRSLASGAWESIATWQTYNGTTWVAAVAPPNTSSGVITIRSPHVVSASTNIVFDQLVVASGSTFITSGQTTVEDGPGNDLTVNGTFTTNLDILGLGNIVISGTMNWFGKLSCETLINVGGILNLNTNATVRTLTQELINNGTINLVTGAISGGDLINNGTIIKSTSSSFTLDPTIENYGTISITGGELINAAEEAIGDFFLNAGIISITSSSIFNNIGSYVHDGGSFTGTGIIRQNGNMELMTAMNLPSTYIFNHNQGVTSGAGGFTVTDLVFNDGTIEGSGALTLQGTTTWAAGTISRDFTIISSRTINLTTNGDRYVGGNFASNGTMNFFGGRLLSNGGLFTNAGTLNKITSTHATIQVSWINTGTINIIAGELENNTVDGETFAKSGTVNISAGATFSNTGYYIHNAGGMTGSGTFFQAGTDFELNASSTIGPTVIFIYADGITSGTGSLTATNATILNGEIGGSGGLTLLGSTTWSGGEITRNFTIGATHTLNVTNSIYERFLGSVLTNNGTVNLLGPGISSTGGSIINSGTLKVDVASTAIDVPLTNNTAGTITGVGALDINSTFTNNGTIAPGSPIGKLTINGVEPLSGSSKLAIQIAGLGGAGIDNDLLSGDGDIILAGTLNVTETAAIPTGNAFTIISLPSGTISGNFATVNLPPTYTLVVNATTVVLNKGTVVPVRLLSFTASKGAAKEVNLRWTTDNEVNSLRFEVERSTDGLNFMNIGSVAAVNLPGTNRYQFIDRYPISGKNIYRLKQVDVDGRYDYSPSRSVQFDVLNISVWPNPATNVIHISYVENFKEYQLIDMSGKILKILNPAGNESMDIRFLRPGQYFLKAIGEAEIQTVPFIKQ